MDFKSAIRKFEFGMEEFLLILLVLITIIDFFKLLPTAQMTSIIFFKTGASYFVLGYLFYRARLTNIFFGQKKKHWDLVIILSYFMLITKQFLIFLQSTQYEVVSILEPFYEFILVNSVSIEVTSFYIGAISLLVLAVVFSRWKFYSPSIMRTIHEDMEAKKNWHRIVRFLSVYLVLVSFFLIVFNILLEWISYATDAPVLILAIFIYLFIWVKHHKKFHPKSFIYKVGNAGDEFYTKLFQLFHYRKTIWIGIFGILVLHIVTDVLNFMVPYIFHLDSLYLQHLAPRASLGTLLAADLLRVGGSIAQFATKILYGLNVIGILSLMLLPGYIWYCMYKHKKFRMYRLALFLFYLSVLSLFLAPIFRLDAISSPIFYGVDILTNQIYDYDLVVHFLITATVIGFIMLIAPIGFVKVARRIAMIVTEAFFGVYIYVFFIDASKYFTNAIIGLFQSGMYFLSFHMFLFFVLSLMFYIGGFWQFLVESFEKPVW